MTSVSTDKAHLKSEHYPADGLDEEEFIWQEHSLKPGFARPVIIHRAILGSVERFVAILIEHLAGKWPFWISPRQAKVLPVSEKFIDYAQSVQLYLHRAGFEVELDRTNVTLPKKVRNAQIDQWNFTLVAGEEEVKAGCVDVRTREGERVGKMRVDEVAKYFESLMPKKSNKYQHLYEKVWSPEHYPIILEHPKEEVKEGEGKKE